jgi:hypothetical protein
MKITQSITLTIISVLFSSMLLAQPVSMAKYKGWSAKFAPTSIFHPIYPAIHVAGEYGFGNGVSIQPELGILMRHGLYGSGTPTTALGFASFDSEHAGFFIKGELRKYINNFPMFYIGGQFQYGYDKMRRTDLFDGTPEFTASVIGNYFCTSCIKETYEIRQNLVGLNFKFGYQQEILPRFLIDVYGGLGLKLLSNKHTGDSDLHKYPAIADSPIHSYQSFFPGTYLFRLPVITLGIKVGYVFGETKVD